MVPFEGTRPRRTIMMDFIGYALVFATGMLTGAHLTTQWVIKGLRKDVAKKTPPRTGAEQYLANRMQDPEYRKAYEEAQKQ